MTIFQLAQKIGNILMMKNGRLRRWLTKVFSWLTLWNIGSDFNARKITFLTSLGLVQCSLSFQISKLTISMGGMINFPPKLRD